MMHTTSRIILPAIVDHILYMIGSLIDIIEVDTKIFENYVLLLLFVCECGMVDRCDEVDEISH